jgi:hypothetical protein
MAGGWLGALAAVEATGPGRSGGALVRMNSSEGGGGRRPPRARGRGTGTATDEEEEGGHEVEDGHACLTHDHTCLTQGRPIFSRVQTPNHI